MTKFTTLFLTLILIVAAHSAVHAQFYTITRSTPITSVVTEDDLSDVGEDENPTSEVESDIELPQMEADSVMIDSRPAVPGRTYAAARKRKPRSIATSTGITETTFPELTIPNLIREIKRHKLRHPEIVLAQAILETGWFTSSVCRNKNNLFGLTNPRTGQYYEFNHWTESVKAYYTKVQYRYKGGNYLLWLRDIGYAEAPNYIQAVIGIMRQLRKQKS